MRRARDLTALGRGRRRRRYVPEAQEPKATAPGPRATPQLVWTLLKLT